MSTSGAAGGALSIREAAAVDAIKAHYAETGLPPSYKELGARIGVNPPQAHELVKRAAQKGRVTVHRRKGYKTEIRLLSRAAELSTAEIIAELEYRTENDLNSRGIGLAA